MFPYLHGHILDDYGYLHPLSITAWETAWNWWYYEDFNCLMPEKKE